MPKIPQTGANCTPPPTQPVVLPPQNFVTLVANKLWKWKGNCEWHGWKNVTLVRSPLPDLPIFIPAKYAEPVVWRQIEPAEPAPLPIRPWQPATATTTAIRRPPSQKRRIRPFNPLVALPGNAWKPRVVKIYPFFPEAFLPGINLPPDTDFDALPAAEEYDPPPGPSRMEAYSFNPRAVKAFKPPFTSLPHPVARLFDPEPVVTSRLLCAKDVEQNPGPESSTTPALRLPTIKGSRVQDGLHYLDDFMLHPDFVLFAKNVFGPPEPLRDAFASPATAQFPLFWDKHMNAFQQDWSTSETLWINPPWTLFPSVIEKILRDQPLCICVLPHWPSGYFSFLMKLATSAFSVRSTSFFSRGKNRPFLPPPRWHLTFIFLNRPYPTSTSWVHNPVQDGDVEANPGPATFIPFPDFIKNEYDHFAPVIPTMDMARPAGNLRARLRATTENFQQALDELTNQFGPTPDGEDIFLVLSAYELFAQSTLIKANNS